jgi:hypothetical protein
MTNQAHSISTHIVGAQTGSTGLRLQAGEVAWVSPEKPLWRRLAVLVAQFGVVAAVVVIGLAWVTHG